MQIARLDAARLDSSVAVTISQQHSLAHTATFAQWSENGVRCATSGACNKSGRPPLRTLFESRKPLAPFAPFARHCTCQQFASRALINYRDAAQHPQRFTERVQYLHNTARLISYATFATFAPALPFESAPRAPALPSPAFSPFSRPLSCVHPADTARSERSQRHPQTHCPGLPSLRRVVVVRRRIRRMPELGPRATTFEHERQHTRLQLPALARTARCFVSRRCVIIRDLAR